MSTTNSTTTRKIYRDTDDQKIGGVCSGLAHYFKLDPLLVRIAFVAVAFIGGGAIIAYLLLWWLADAAPEGHWAEPFSDTTSEGFEPPAVDTAIQADIDVAA